MKKIFLLAFLLMSINNAFSQKRTHVVRDNSDMITFISKAIGINIIGFYTSIISKDSVYLEHLAYYENGKQVSLYNKQVDSLLDAKGCREKVYPEIKKHSDF